MAVQHASRDKFLALFDEFTGVPGPKLDLYLQLAAQQLSQRRWGANWEFAVCYLAAHVLVSGGGNAGSQSGSGGAAGGALTQVQVGDLSKSFTAVGDTAARDNTYMTTAYGRMFIQLRRATIVSAGATGYGSGVC